MKCGNLFRLLAPLVLAVCATQARAGYRTYVVRPPINNDAILDDEALPVECRDETAMKLICARDEYEPASFLVDADAPLKQVMVKVSPLQGDAGTLPPETVDVRIAQKFNMPVTWQNDTLPWVLVHDPGMMKIVEQTPKYFRELKTEKVGGHPLAEYQAGHSKINKLLKDLVDSDILQPGDVEGRQQFWLTVKMPADAKTGTYRGQVTISAENAETKTLTLEVTVPSFDLLPPKFEYSVYYPTEIDRPDFTDAQRAKLNPITEEQYVAECRDMAAHGCTNPNIYCGPEQGDAGNIEFTRLSRILYLREQAGLPKGVMLYLFDGAGMLIKAGVLTEKEKQRNIEVAKATVSWAKEHGYSGAMFMGADEQGGEQLRAMRDSYASVQAGGSGIWVACGNDFLDIAGDVIDRPILAHPGALIVDSQQQWQVTARDWLLNRQQMVRWDPALLLMPDYQRSIRGAHEKGHKIFTYFDPQGGMQFPEMHRRHRGMGLWKTGLDGTMTWAYIHINTMTCLIDNPLTKQRIEDEGIPADQNGFVLRGPKGPLDTLGWEGYREGYDDARYLATLQDALTKAKGDSKKADLVARTRRWLDNLSVNADLDEWRIEMVHRTQELIGR